MHQEVRLHNVDQPKSYESRGRTANLSGLSPTVGSLAGIGGVLLSSAVMRSELSRADLATVSRYRSMLLLSPGGD